MKKEHMTKLEHFRKYLANKQAYYIGKPIVSDYEYDIHEIECRKLFPDDDDFYLPGYGDEHEKRLSALETKLQELGDPE